MMDQPQPSLKATRASTNSTLALKIAASPKVGHPGVKFAKITIKMTNVYHLYKKMLAALDIFLTASPYVAVVVASIIV